MPKIITIFILFSFLLSPVLARADFNPNYIISDTEILDYNSMSLAEVKEFMASQGGILHNYICADIDGNPRLVPEVIYTLGRENNINPKFMLTLLQKEQSLLTDSNPSEGQLKAATGYGCPDSGGCNSRWRDLFKQINSAYLQFKSYMEEPHLYAYKIDETYTFSDRSSRGKTETAVTPQSQATAALYNYTPHVYDGNYNFWKLWNKYFTFLYPDGTLLSARDEPGVYLIQKGKKRPFLTKGAFLSRYSEDKVIQTDRSLIDKYTEGTPIKFSNYSILKSAKGDIYLLVDDILRKFSSPEIFKKIGFNPEEIIEVEDSDIALYKKGIPITQDDIYPTGALLQNKKTGGIYFVQDGIKYPIWHRNFLKINFEGRKIIPAEEDDLAKYATGEAVKLRDGELVTSPGTTAVYVISNGEKRPIISGEIFEKLGYKWEQVINISDKVLEIHPTGEIIDKT